MTKKYIAFSTLSTLLLAVGLALSHCGTQQTPPTTTTTTNATFGTPLNFAVNQIDGGAIISFQYNPTATGGYKIYFGDTSDFTDSQGVLIPSPYSTTSNSITMNGLKDGTTYYFAATAIKSDGTESAKTSTVSVVPTSVGSNVQKEVNAEMDICFNHLDKIRFVNDTEDNKGEMMLSYHESGSSYPGQGDCDIDGIQLRTFDDVGNQINEREMPNGTYWAPTALGAVFDMAIPYFVPGNITITDLQPVSVDCDGASPLTVTVENDTSGVPNTINFNADACDASHTHTFKGSTTIKFNLHYVTTQ